MSAHLPASLQPVQDADMLLARAARDEETVEGVCIRGADLSGTRYEGLRLRGVLSGGLPSDRLPLGARGFCGCGAGRL